MKDLSLLLSRFTGRAVEAELHAVAAEDHLPVSESVPHAERHSGGRPNRNDLPLQVRIYIQYESYQHPYIYVDTYLLHDT